MMMLTSLAPLASIQTIGEIKYIFKVIKFTVKPKMSSFHTIVVSYNSLLEYFSTMFLTFREL